jgi:hypothetical protein
MQSSTGLAGALCGDATLETFEGTAPCKDGSVFRRVNARRQIIVTASSDLVSCHHYARVARDPGGMGVSRGWVQCICRESPRRLRRK